MALLLEEIIRSVELLLRLRNQEKKPYVDPNLDPVLLVPGIAGSILNAVDHENGTEERVWVRIFGADREFRTKLWSKFDPSTGKTITLDPKTSIVVPEDRAGLYAIDVLDPDMIIGAEGVYYFHEMIVEMIGWGFQEGKTLFGFGYDFRQSNRLQETMDHFAKKLESVYKASGEKKINVISHSMGGLLVKCFMSLHSDIFEKYVKNWIAVAAPFRGAPGYITSALLNGMSFVNGWEQNFFISKWSMHQLLIECPSIYELMCCPGFEWQLPPVLELWREKQSNGETSDVVLESYCTLESVNVFKEALASNAAMYDGEAIPLPFNRAIMTWAHETHRILSSAKLPPQVKFYNIYGTNLDTPHSVCYGNEKMPVKDLTKLRYFQPTYICVDGDGTVPVESAMADGLKAEARVGVPGEHRGILNDHRVFRMLKQWLKVGEPDPLYNPINDYVIIPTTFEMERHHEKGIEVTSVKEEWEIISSDNDRNGDDTACVSSISISQAGNDQNPPAEARATLVVLPQNDGRQHVELNAVSVSVDT
ncbi:PREDICTED: lecithin-cholesterol acyltransferase-like 4 [Tarenaya hassleriana]|uniref:lecithin-cholesterol acyltransferase-like 4 n=1 Tax=Tarenaya hassleriana TaxID=28532 RepID=UPI00053C5175|nr:PREDICTED: lecithin-cholesterol acyltransferase-like 4 [Tarenaya hassleriana]